MDMDGFPGTGGDEPTDGPQSPEDGEQVETAVQMTKDAGGLKHAVLDNKYDGNGWEHGNSGLFTGKYIKGMNSMAEAMKKAPEKLQSSKSDGNIEVAQRVAMKSLPNKILVKKDTKLLNGKSVIPANSTIKKIVGFAVGGEIR